MMPFEVAGSPAPFQSLMKQLLDGLEHHSCVAFMNDILLCSSTLKDNTAHVRKVLQWIQAVGLNINSDKVQIFQKSPIFLGHVVSPEHCWHDPEKLSAVMNSHGQTR